MRFQPVPIADAQGTILGHNIANREGRRALRKGRVLTSVDLETLRALGRETVYVAVLEAGDVGEDTAAERVARAAASDTLRRSAARTGRVNLYAQDLGLLRVDVETLARLNGIPGVTLATLLQHTVVRAGVMVATLKITPYALSEDRVEEAEALLAGSTTRFATPLLAVEPLPPRRVGLVLSGAAAARERVVGGFERALGERLERWGSRLASVDFVPIDDDHGVVALAAVFERQLSAELDLLVVAGETAIQDRQDMIPRAIERVGGEIAAFGVPVDPGNLLLLAYCGEVPVVGAPGCARSPKRNIVDLVLPRLLAGHRLGWEDLLSWGHGGLLEDVPERPLPRSRLG